MKSPMINNASYIKDKENYTEMKVLRSPAGYYIGTMYWDSEYHCWDAGSRDSDYFPTKELAEEELARIIETEDISSLRTHP